VFTHSGNRSRTAIGIIHRSAEWNLGRHRPKFHMSANVLAALPKSAHPGAIKAMQQNYSAEDIDHTLARRHRGRLPGVPQPSRLGRQLVVPA
jgi:hypothetical protein